MELMSLFPTPVAFFDLPREFTQHELNFIKNQTQTPNMGNTSSKDTYVLNKPELVDIKEFCLSSVNQYFQAVYFPDTAVKLRITQSWSNYTNGGQFHHKHAHPNSIVSGVLYVQSDSTKDRIYFYKTDYQQLKVETRNWNTFNSESWWFEAIQYRLILFPSSLTHAVPTISENSVTRISISFNTFPVGQIGSNNELTELFLDELYVQV